MLRLVRLVDQFSRLERTFEGTWSRLELELVLADEGLMDRAAALLAPANPGRAGNRLRFATARHGRGIGPEALRRLLTRLDEEDIEGRLQLHDLERAPSGVPSVRQTMHDQWMRALAALPSDWSDVYAEVRLDSSDYVEPAALLLAPVNPSRCGGVATLCFRCARRFGYGVSPEMAARCLQRCDEQGLTGKVEILHVLSDTDPVATQGPVWLVGGRVV
jgi:hypothetical protein